MGMQDGLQMGGGIITTQELKDYKGPKDKVKRKVVGETADGKKIVSDQKDVRKGEKQILNG